MVRISGGKYTASRTQGNRRIFSEGYLNKGNCSNHSSSLLDGDSKSRSDNMNQKQFSEHSCFGVIYSLGVKCLS